MKINHLFAYCSLVTCSMTEFFDQLMLGLPGSWRTMHLTIDKLADKTLFDA